MPTSSIAAFLLLSVVSDCLSSNVCIFPLLTRNQTAPTQLMFGVLTAMVILLYSFPTFFPMASAYVPFWLQLLVSPFLSLPLLPAIIPFEGLLVFLFSRGDWHDRKRQRLQLLFDRMNEFDVIAVQELYSGIFDTRYRDLVIREAQAHGLHYYVQSDRIPTFPAFLLNAGTLLLSRYPILNSKVHIFKNRAFYDALIVNRGCSWMRIELPINHEVVDIFTCHLAPPLKEVSERVRLLEYCTCAQDEQLKELVQFMSDCTADIPKSNRRVVLAADLNIDCGSMKYFELLHSLQQVAPMKDIFAISHSDDNDLKDSNKSVLQAARVGDVSETDSDTDSAGADDSDGFQLVESQTRQSPPSSPGHLSLSTLGANYNVWSAENGNGREAFVSHSIEKVKSLLPNTKRLHWEPTFGQRIRSIVATSTETTAATFESSSLSCQSQVSSVSYSDSESPRSNSSPTPPSACEHDSTDYMETFLTHPTLLGSHSTHDFMFSSLLAVNQRVDPFFTKQAKQKLSKRHQPQTAFVNQADSNKNEKLKKSRPTFTQLSDHSALFATLMLPKHTDQQTEAD